MEQSLDNDLVKCIYEGLDMKHTDPSQLSPLVLAYIGDSIYDLVIKTWVIEQCKVIHISQECKYRRLQKSNGV